MPAPHWSHRLSQNPNDKATSAGKRTPQAQAAVFEAILRNAKIGASAQSNRFKKSSNINITPRPFTQYKKTETARKSLLDTGGIGQRPLYSREKLRDSPADTKNKVRFLETNTRVESASTNIKSKSGAEKHSALTLTESVLQRHNEYIRKNSHVSMMDRVSAWVKSVPLFLDDPETNTRPIESPLPKTIPSLIRPRTMSPTKRYHSAINLSSTFEPTSNIERPKSQLHQRSLPLLVESNLSPIFVSSWSSNEKVDSARRMKEPQTNALGDYRRCDSERGKLLCCLKVEIKNGIYKMLPIHQNDDPTDLSATFCKTYRLVGSLESLKMHIQSSLKTYGK